MWPAEEFCGRIKIEEEVFIGAMGQLEVITEELLPDDKPIDFSWLRWRELGLIGRGTGILGDILLGRGLRVNTYWRGRHEKCFDPCIFSSRHRL